MPTDYGFSDERAVLRERGQTPRDSKGKSELERRFSSSSSLRRSASSRTPSEGKQQFGGAEMDAANEAHRGQTAAHASVPNYPAIQDIRRTLSGRQRNQLFHQAMAHCSRQLPRMGHASFGKLPREKC